MGLRATLPYLKSWDRNAATELRPLPGEFHRDQGPHRRRLRHRCGHRLPAGRDAAADELEPITEVARLAGRRGSSNGCYYLVVSRLLPYKNVDAIVRAFAGTDRRLVVVGRGPEADRLRQLKTDNVIMLSNLTDGALAWLYKNCKAIIAASYEDYGLTPLEAGVWGSPQSRFGSAAFSTPFTRT